MRALDTLHVTHSDNGFSAVAYLYIDPDTPILRGHFPGLPLYPGVLMVETLCQAMSEALRNQDKNPWLRSIQSLRLTAAVHGDDELRLHIDVTARDGEWLTQAVGRRRDGVAAVTITATFGEEDMPG